MNLSPEQTRRIDEQLALLERVRAIHLGSLPLYFAHFRIQSGSRQSDLLLGNASKISSELPILDWQNAPLAEVFFSCSEGEEYELEIEGRVVTGRLVEKNQLTFRDGCLDRIEALNFALERNEAGRWIAIDDPHPHITSRPLSARHPFKSPLEVELDPAQRAVVELPADRNVLLLGEAGFGKTTVALHRLVALAQRRGRRFKGAVIVPTEGLRRLTQLMLDRRKAPGIEVWTYDAWAQKVARRAFTDLPRSLSANARGGVVRLKRHRALRAAIELYAREKPFPPGTSPTKAPLRVHAGRPDLELLFGDRRLLELAVGASNQEIRTNAIAEVIEHTKVQFSERTETQFAHVTDRDRLQAADEKSLDEGTPTEDAQTVDAEDFAVLFELDRLRADAAGRRPAKVASYDCIVVDEAQELASLELSLIGRALAKGGTLIVAGDAGQRVDPGSDFAGWELVMKDLGVQRYERSTLEVSYRCPPAVTQLARSVIGLGLNKPALDPSIIRARHAHPCHLVAWLIDELRQLTGEDPSSSIALITRYATSARLLSRTLGHGLTVHLALGGDFSFRPGVQLTCVPEVKGLEFDHVIIPDADAQAYPDDAEARRALYVALTRTTHQLALASSSGRWSTLIGL